MRDIHCSAISASYLLGNLIKTNSYIHIYLARYLCLYTRVCVWTYACVFVRDRELKSNHHCCIMEKVFVLQPIVRELHFGRGYANFFDYYYLYTPSCVLCLIYNKNQANLLVIALVTSSYTDKHCVFPILRKHFNTGEKVTNRIKRKTTRTIVNVNR